MRVEMTIAWCFDMGAHVGEAGEGHRDQPDLHEQREGQQLTGTFYREHALVLQPPAWDVKPLH
jgi:hypothetical protein